MPAPRGAFPAGEPDRARPLLAFALLWLVATACNDGTAPEVPGPSISTIDVGSDSGSIFRTLHVSSPTPIAIQVDYWTAAAPRLRVVRATPATDHTVFLPGLRPGELYDYEVRPVQRGVAGAVLHRGQVTTDELPEDLAQIRFTAFGTPTNRLTMLELRGTPYSGYVIVDEDGAVVWYRRGIAESFTRRANGNFVLLDTPGLTEVRPDLTVVAELPRGGNLSMHHDVVATPANTLLFLSQEPAVFGEATWVGEAVWEWNPDDGTLVQRWNAADFLSPDAGDIGPWSVPSDWLHANSLALGPRGNVVVSFPFLNQIISISPDYQALEWRLGGPNATIVPESNGEFWFEHTAAEIATDHVLLFDNGRGRPEGFFSRALELKLDRTSGRATRAWEFRSRPDIYAPIISSARRLPNGNTFVGFGTRAGFLEATGPMAAFEVTSGGLVLWTLRITGAELLNYRATPLKDIAGEVVVQAR